MTPELLASSPKSQDPSSFPFMINIDRLDGSPTAKLDQVHVVQTVCRQVNRFATPHRRRLGESNLPALGCVSGSSQPLESRGGNAIIGSGPFRGTPTDDMAGDHHQPNGSRLQGPPNGRVDRMRGNARTRQRGWRTLHDRRILGRRLQLWRAGRSSRTLRGSEFDLLPA